MTYLRLTEDELTTLYRTVQLVSAIIEESEMRPQQLDELRRKLAQELIGHIRGEATRRDYGADMLPIKD